ncbi:DUF961 domain-containing protein [Enterococcus faecalis]|uniref:DUF961 family protein n=1 Tax=Enterococcus faecalis TaxID=1351 RepID=UPI001AD63551|nr:DUF961 family protein [Enterococcus faecalis]MBO6438749.1 DUF961 domain-containing protein [Enterococcus faecalis]MBO6453362.1 DUF961 domain-containing protein [Enterococcus faecalis]
MSLKYVRISEDSLGTVLFIKHLETIGRQVQRGRLRQMIAEQEVYEVMSAEKGSFTVTVPVSGTLKGDFYKKAVTLVNPKVVIQAVSSVNRSTGEVGARPRVILHAEKIELVGGKQNG